MTFLRFFDKKTILGGSFIRNPPLLELVSLELAPMLKTHKVFGGDLQPCQHDGGQTGYFRDNMCHAPGDPNHHEVCATITKDFWPESGQGHTGIYGKWCICVHKLGDWLRGASAHHGIVGVDCNATSVEALKGDQAAANFIAKQCPGAVEAVRAATSPLVVLCPDEKNRQSEVPKRVDDFL